VRRMNPMEAVVRVLEDEGVRVAFGIPGAAAWSATTRSMVNNGYMGLIRQAEEAYDMNYEVKLSYDGPEGHPGIDHVAVMKAMGSRRRARDRARRDRGRARMGGRPGRRARRPGPRRDPRRARGRRGDGRSIDHVREFEAVQGEVPEPFAPMPELAG
jgi:hypothetical protein